MKAIIVGLTKERAKKKLEEIIKNIPAHQIKTIFTKESMQEVMTYDGDNFLAMVGSEFERGFLCDKLYVDEELPIRILQSAKPYIREKVYCFNLDESINETNKEKLSNYIKDRKEQINDLICNVIYYQSDNCPIDYMNCEECWKIAHKALLES